MNWFESTNIYEVNVRQYTQEGTFAAFSKHLDRLKNMGVETLWFMPITPISEKNKKGSLGSYYACSDYTAINQEFGTLEDFKALVKRIHELGMKVIIDWVANHTGWDHVWTKLHPEWYKKDETGDFKKASGMDDIIELDFSNDDMRKEMIRCMEYWVKECDIDGFRCDLAFWVRVDFWEEAIPVVNKTKALFWLAESDPIEHPEYMTVFNAAYSWQWMHKSEDFAKHRFDWETLKLLLDQYEKVPGIKAWFTSNHDENSWNGTEYEKYGEMALPLAVFSCTWKGMPLLYSGQELPNMKRLLFFDKDVIEWKDDIKLQHFYKVLLHLHSSHPALNSISSVKQLAITNDHRILAYNRVKNESAILVILNFNDENKEIELLDAEWGDYINAFSNEALNLHQHKKLSFQPWQYIVAYKK